jgi:hypothetical protein
VAKKSRTPPPPRSPRPIQAPKRRDTPSRPGTGINFRDPKILGGAAAVALGAVVAVVLVLVLGGKGGSDASGSSSAAVAKAMAAAGCTYVSKPVLPPTKDKTGLKGGFHLDSPTLTSKVKWSTFPPSGGGHYPLWAVWGFYTQAVNPRQVVHNEEHGGVVLWWGPDVSQSEIAKLSSFYQSSPQGMLGTPIAGLGNKIAITAWTGDPKRYYRSGYYGIGHLATCTSFNQKAFTTFRDAFRGHGPEGIPLSADAPGTGPSG